MIGHDLVGVDEGVEVELAFRRIPCLKAPVVAHIPVDGAGVVELELGQISTQDTVGLLPRYGVGRLEVQTTGIGIPTDEPCLIGPLHVDVEGPAPGRVLETGCRRVGRIDSQPVHGHFGELPPGDRRVREELPVGVPIGHRRHLCFCDAITAGPPRARRIRPRRRGTGQSGQRQDCYGGNDDGRGDLRGVESHLSLATGRAPAPGALSIWRASPPARVSVSLPRTSRRGI